MALPNSDGVVADVEADVIEPSTVDVPRAKLEVADSDVPSTAEVPGATGGVNEGDGTSVAEVPGATEGVAERRRGLHLQYSHQQRTVP